MKTINELEGKIYFTCSACMSVWADGLSWANAHLDRVTKDIKEADNVIVLSCQVTDLAVLNDLNTIERLYGEFPARKYFISGCLAKREDIEIPAFAERLETPRENYQFLYDRTLVNFEKPFWVKDFKEDDEVNREGHLFRHMYPLRIGKGCPNKCSYCTIRITRGEFEKLEMDRLEKEFLTFDDVILIADSPRAEQLREWCRIAKIHSKPFSIRNVEPAVVVEIEKELIDLANCKLLKMFHSPVQSCAPDILRDMGRSVEATLEAMRIVKELKDRGVYVATNIIIDYKGFLNITSDIYKLFDHVSWNPLWDGKWDRKKAEERFEYYIKNRNKEVE